MSRMISGVLGVLGVLDVLAATTGGTASAQSPPAPSSPATPRLKVVIVPGVAVNIEPARVDALAQDLATALSTELDVDATGGLEVRRALPAEGVAPDCVTTPACVADVAQRTGATQLLFVVMVDSGEGGSIQIDSTWIEPASGRSAARSAVDITTIGEARARFAAAARSLLPDAPLRPNVNPPQVIHVDSTGGAPRHLTTPALILGGVAIAGVGVGIGFGLATRSEYNGCDADPAACTSNQRDTIRNVGHVADAGWLVAIGGAIATTVMFATSGEQPHFVVTPTGGGAAAFALGSF